MKKIVLYLLLLVFNLKYDTQKDIDDKNYLEEELCPYKLEPNQNLKLQEFDGQEEFD